MPSAAYIHVPFCRHHCGYCNFTVVSGREDLAGAYLQALEKELGALGGPHPVETIFIGGGTPTHLALSQLTSLLGIVGSVFTGATEYSVEANPRDALDVAKLQALKEHGVTRISLGAQSFHPRKLLTLERDHDEAVIRAAVENARALGFAVSLDLIFGAPGETLAEWQEDLSQAISLAPDHISTYGLTFEKGTAFWGRLARGELVQAAEELERDMYLAAIDALTAAGFEHYEVSNFALPGQRCRHNENYWLGGEYFAAGPGASRYVAGRRETNHRSTTAWISRVLAGESAVAESDDLSAEEVARERLVFSLRRLEGIDTHEFALKTGLSVDELAAEPLARFVEQGLLAREGNRLRLTRAGLLVSDALWPYLL